jgi:hypothetical protein
MLAPTYSYEIWEKIKGIVYTIPLSGLYEFLPAFGTGDGDLTLSFGHSHLLTAPGTVVIAVILVFQLLEKDQKFAVLFVALINVPGQGTDNGHDHEGVGNGGAGQLENCAGDQRSQQREYKTGAEDRHIQLIRAIAASHKPLHTHAQFIEKISQPVSQSVHILLLG